MSVAFRSDSSVAQFQEDPFTRDWPEAAAIDALFRYCVGRFLAICRNEPRNWLTKGDLLAILGQILRVELPSHGLPACAVHVGFTHSHPLKQELSGKHQRTTQVIDLVLVMPQTIHWVSETRWDAELAMIASIKRGHEHLGEIRNDLTRLAAIKGRIAGLLCYLVVMGYHDEPNQIELVIQAAHEQGIAYLGDNYTSLTTPVIQEKLL